MRLISISISPCKTKFPADDVAYRAKAGSPTPARKRQQTSGALARSRPKGPSRESVAVRGNLGSRKVVSSYKMALPKNEVLRAKFRCTKARRGGKSHRYAVFRDGRQRHRNCLRRAAHTDNRSVDQRGCLFRQLGTRLRDHAGPAECDPRGEIPLVLPRSP